MSENFSEHSAAITLPIKSITVDKKLYRTGWHNAEGERPTWMLWASTPSMDQF